MPGLDITPQIAEGQRHFEGYGDGCFRITGAMIEGSLVIWPDGYSEWNVTSAGQINAKTLISALTEAGDVEVLLIGCGETFGPEPDGLRTALRDAGYVLEWMDTGAACRTYNVLLGEGRLVAAALIAIN